MTAPLLRKPGQHEVLVTIAEGETHDLLVGTLDHSATERAQAAAARPGLREVVADALKALAEGRKAIAFAGIVLLAAAAGGALLGRRKLLIVPAAILGLILASAIAWAHDGHDHGPDLSASAGNSPFAPSRRQLFVPKPTQRLLESARASSPSRRKTAHRPLQRPHRRQPQPQRRGAEHHAGPLRGAGGRRAAARHAVKAGDLLGRVAPSFASIDSSDMAQTLGTLDQEIALDRRKLARQEQLLASNAVAKATVEDTRIQLEGLEKRRQELLAARCARRSCARPSTA